MRPPGPVPGNSGRSEGPLLGELTSWADTTKSSASAQSVGSQPQMALEYSLLLGLPIIPRERQALACGVVDDGEHPATFRRHEPVSDPQSAYDVGGSWGGPNHRDDEFRPSTRGSRSVIARVAADVLSQGQPRRRPRERLSDRHGQLRRARRGALGHPALAPGRPLVRDGVQPGAGAPARSSRRSRAQSARWADDGMRPAPSGRGSGAAPGEGCHISWSASWSVSIVDRRRRRLAPARSRTRVAKRWVSTITAA